MNGGPAQDELPILPSYAKFLPPKLNSLTMDNISGSFVLQTYTAYDEASDITPTMLNDFITFLLSLRLSNITIIIDMSTWTTVLSPTVAFFHDIDEPALHSLRTFADTLKERGLNLSIRYRMDN
jgi:hypothetical protein